LPAPFPKEQDDIAPKGSIVLATEDPIYFFQVRRPFIMEQPESDDYLVGSDSGIILEV